VNEGGGGGGGQTGVTARRTRRVSCTILCARKGEVVPRASVGSLQVGAVAEDANDLAVHVLRGAIGVERDVNTSLAIVAAHWRRLLVVGAEAAVERLSRVVRSANQGLTRDLEEERRHTEMSRRYERANERARTNNAHRSASTQEPTASRREGRSSAVVHTSSVMGAFGGRNFSW